NRAPLAQSCLIQDEPGGGAGFSYKMSLEERSRMLGFDHQRADIGTIEPGADSGVFGRQFRGRIQGPESRGGIRLGGSDATAATIRRADPQRAWIGAAVRGEDDWTEPGADDAADHSVLAGRRGEAAALPAAPVHQPHGGRVTEQAADRADQIPTAALQRQWAGREQERRGGAEVDGVHAYCRAARSGDHGVFPRAPEPILELSPTVRGAGVGSERQGKGEASVPMVRDAMGDPAATAGRGQPSQGRGNDSDAGSTGAGQERYAGGGRNAASET